MRREWGGDNDGRGQGTEGSQGDVHAVGRTSGGVSLVKSRCSFDSPCCVGVHTIGLFLIPSGEVTGLSLAQVPVSLGITSGDTSEVS